jgi:hypothetical protein
MSKGRAFIVQLKTKIYSKSFQSIHRIGSKCFMRQRKLTFPIVFSMLLKLVKKSLSIECELMEPSEKNIPPSKQAFSKARYKISHTGFQELLATSIETTYKETNYGTWRGYRLIAVDGSSIRLPASKEIEIKFGRFKANRDGIMPPVARVSLFVDLCTSLICNARLAPWNIGEQTLAEEQLPEVIEQMQCLSQNKLLFIYDRGYPSIRFINQHQELGADFIFRLQSRTYLKLWERVENGEIDFDFMMENKTTKIEQVRIVVLTLKDGTKEVLATSLLNRSNYSIEDLGKIYCLRWHIEECYKRLKVGAELENFSGKNLEAILQEFWAHLVMCNILSLHMCDEQGPWDPDKTPLYRLNFSVLFGVMRRKLYEVLVGQCDEDTFESLFKRAASRAKVKIRPGRLYSRAKVDIPKRHHVFRRVC